MKKVPVALLFVLLASFALVACGSSSSSSSSESTASEAPAETTEESGAAAGGEKEAASGPSLEIETASSGLAYSSKTAETEAGKVDVEFSNGQSIPHDVAFEDSSGKTVGQTEVIAEGASATSVDLKPGTYTFFCTIPGHREAGMEGTLTVK